MNRANNVGSRIAVIVACIVAATACICACFWICNMDQFKSTVHMNQIGNPVASDPIMMTPVDKALWCLPAMLTVVSLILNVSSMLSEKCSSFPIVSICLNILALFHVTAGLIYWNNFDGLAAPFSALAAPILFALIVSFVAFRKTAINRASNAAKERPSKRVD